TQLPAIDRALRQVLCHDDLRFCVNGSLGVVGLHEPVLALHDAAVGIGEVLLGFCIWLSGGRGSFRSGFPPPFGLRFSCASAAALSLASAAAFASSSNSALALRIVSARRFLSATHSGISSPVLSRPCSLSSSASAASAALSHLPTSASSSAARFSMRSEVIALCLDAFGFGLASIERDVI